MVVSLFVTPENGILVQDSFASAGQGNRLLTLEIPYYYFSKKVCINPSVLNYVLFIYLKFYYEIAI